MRTQFGHPAVPSSLVRSIVATYAPRRIILFGSAARGEAGPGSDIDLAVELDDDVPKEMRHWRRSWEARRGYDGAVDIVPFRASVLREKANAPGHLARDINAEGVVIYERG